VITLLATPEALLGSETSVEGDAYRHLFRARRTEVGERMRVVDGLETARWGEVARVAKTAALLKLGEPAPKNEPAFRLTLVAPTCRPERAAWLVEKATEIGVCRIAFVHTERAPRELGPGTFDRLRRLARAAVEQCHRTRVPEIDGPHAWKDLESLTAGAEHRWVLDTTPSSEGGGAWGERSGESGALLVGPEGGWTSEERQELQLAGYRAVHLGDRVLRLETAAIAGAAILLLARPV
jgi:16S rRNA (uracil1498-N3)-methyltransferase